MGGFAGGDEAGYWDIDTLPTSIDKKNNKTKEKLDIEKSDSGVYTLKAYAKGNKSFKVIEDLYDTISFVPCKCENFTIEGCENIPLESNSIYKAYKALSDYTRDSDIEDFFCEYKVVVVKNIPLGKGLGGSSSDAAAFMRLLKEVCNLVLSNDELAKIGMLLSPNIPFFIYNESYKC